eukprot:CAMPEP_0173441038 /NCGR_PEP_ID=MMETSP1357-20121228/23743_1 /TAXON_ID=77926 /ORGANISM="Hemiselmis rufescens, Strain PCC563" /LENGTH=118 /DNA_ID=CAMNT_0014406589 /DNA_START=193 /DNA_END=546 /DNA_ORIENTATION=+
MKASQASSPISFSISLALYTGRPSTSSLPPFFDLPLYRASSAAISALVALPLAPFAAGDSLAALDFAEANMSSRSASFAFFSGLAFAAVATALDLALGLAGFLTLMAFFAALATPFAM